VVGRVYSKDFLIIHIWRARERQPITRVWGSAPSGGSGAEPPVEGQGRSLTEADEVFVFKTVIFSGLAAVLRGIMYNLYLGLLV